MDKVINELQARPGPGDRTKVYQGIFLYTEINEATKRGNKSTVP